MKLYDKNGNFTYPLGPLTKEEVEWLSNWGREEKDDLLEDPLQSGWNHESEDVESSFVEDYFRAKEHTREVKELDNYDWSFYESNDW